MADIYEDNETLVIDVVHEHVHRGHFFQSSYKTADASPIADNAAVVIHVKTGARYTHFAYGCMFGGEGEVEFYEGPTVSGNGTAISRISLNRAANSYIPTTLVFHTPSTSANGTLLSNFMTPGGNTGANRSGAAVRPESEWILKPNTSYLIRATNRAGTAQQASVIVAWYEKEENSD